jgi:hypothetical protein
MKELFKTETMIFPAWTSLLRDEPSVSQRLERIQALREKRSNLNFSIPHIYLDSTFWRNYKLYIEIRRLELELGEEHGNLPIEQAYQAHKEWISIFTPLVHRTFWARWLYLERAFELASLSGDLLFGAISLRTLVEDVWALLEVATYEKHLEEKRPVVTLDDFIRIRRHGDLLFERFLPPLHDVESLPDSDTPKPFGEYEGLRQAFQALNDYVHPNYGSHLLALFPERAKVLTVLMDAYITVYEHFFQIPWVYEPVEGQSSELPPIELRSMVEETHFLLDETYPAIQRHRAKRNLAPEDADPAPHLRKWLVRSGESELLELAWQIAPDWFDPLIALAEFITGDSSKSKQDLCNTIIMKSENLGLPMRFTELILLAGARRLAKELEENFPNGRPSPGNSILWFRFFVKALSLILTTTQYKMSLMIWSTIRQLNDQNPIGAILASRSVVEHYAVAIYLGDRLQRVWEEFLKGATTGKLPANVLTRMEKEVARFLAGTKGTVEKATAWKEEWTRRGLNKAISLRSATKEGLAKDVQGFVYDFLYDFGSRVIHGTRARGVELCPPTDRMYRMANLSRALLAVDQLTSIESMLNLIGDGATVLERMYALAEALDQPNADRSRILKTVATAKNGLIPGKHYTGSGTMDDPFVFAEGLDYYDAFYKLCRQLDLNTDQRRLMQGPTGRFFDAVPDKAGQLFYFAAPIDRLMHRLCNTPHPNSS